jgi:hypothetical protein
MIIPTFHIIKYSCLLFFPGIHKQAIRNAKNRDAKAQQAETQHNHVLERTDYAARPPSPKKVIYVGSTRSPKRTNLVASPVSVTENKLWWEDSLYMHC